MTAVHKTRDTRADHLPKWQPGVSANPGGRPKGLASEIRERTANGEQIIDIVLNILLHPAGKPVQRQKLQMEAANYLTDRGWGKALATVEHSGAIGLDVRHFDGVDTEVLKLIVAANAVLDAESEATGMPELEAHDDGTQTV